MFFYWRKQGDLWDGTLLDSLVVILATFTFVWVTKVDVLIVLGSGGTHVFLLTTAVISSVKVVIIAAPHALWIVGGSLSAHRCLLSIIDSGAAMHRLASIIAATIGIALRSLIATGLFYEIY